MLYSFYAQSLDPNLAPSFEPLDGRYTSVLWQPALGSLVPRGVPKVPFAVWWCFHYSHTFSNRDYAVFVVYDGNRVIHRSGIFPGYFRFPFMSKDDLQIGDTWTAPEYRGQGLASSAIRTITNAYRKAGRSFWYVVDQDNLASIRVIEKTGFVKVGEGIRTKRLGSRALGAYVIQQCVTPDN